MKPENKSFNGLGVNKALLKNINGMNITVPTDIQEKSIPSIVKGRDVIGESATGSGKTLAFTVGIVQKVKQHKGLQALILTPTRELAEQVKEAVKEFSYGMGLKIIPVYGGTSIHKQIQGLETAEIVIATPGRLLDHLERGTIDTSRVKLLVLDEADRMLDMGFLPDVESIIEECRSRNQTLFFSATLPPKIQKLANKYMKQPIKVAASNQVDPAKLKQEYYFLEKNQKMSLLVHLLQKEKSGLVLVFCNTRKTTDFVAKNLRNNHVKAVPIHGGLTQNKRTRTMKLFDKGKAHVLVCTDVAARGLHIEDVSHIYNYDLPKEPQDYVHRIGRTARAGKTGKVINIVTKGGPNLVSRIKKAYPEMTITQMDVPELPKVLVTKHEYPRKKFFKKRTDRHDRNVRHKGNIHRKKFRKSKFKHIKRKKTS